jgi:hypothetical protein
MAEEVTTERFKNCPFCSEQILAAAIKCKHCGSSLSDRKPTIHRRSFGQRVILTGLVCAAVGCVLGLLLGGWLGYNAGMETSIFDVPIELRRQAGTVKGAKQLLASEYLVAGAITLSVLGTLGVGFLGGLVYFATGNRNKAPPLPVAPPTVVPQQDISAPFKKGSRRWYVSWWVASAACCGVLLLVVPLAIMTSANAIIDPDLAAVRAYLKQNTDTGQWEEVRWWPSRELPTSPSKPVAVAVDRLQETPSRPLSNPAGPIDKDPQEFKLFCHDSEAILDKTTSIHSYEMPAYWRVMDWVQSQSLADFQARSLPEVPFQNFLQHPGKYRGRPVRVELNIQKVLSIDLDDTGNGSRPKKLYELWGLPTELDGYYYVVVTPELPRGFPVGKQVDVTTTVYGYFFKLQGYIPFEAKPDARPLLAPMLIGRLDCPPVAPEPKQERVCRLQYRERGPLGLHLTDEIFVVKDGKAEPAPRFLLLQHVYGYSAAGLWKRWFPNDPE